MQLDSPLFKSLVFENYSIVINYTIPGIENVTRQKSTISQIITFSPDSPVIDFTTIVKWKHHDKLLKVAFPTTVRARSARFGIQFGHIQRPTHWNTLRDLAKFETVGRWADLGDLKGGVALCSDVKAGFDVHENVIRLSLLKSPLQPDQWADRGTRKFVYRAVFHDSSSLAQIIYLSDELIVPPVLRKCDGQSDGVIPPNASFCDITDRYVILETLKPAFDEDGFVARFYEASGSWRQSIVTFPLLEANKWDIEIVDLLERKTGETLRKNDATQLSFCLTLKCFELLTVLVRRHNA
jgi:alpha-mannosidase